MVNASCMCYWHLDSIADKAWSMLRTALERLEPKEKQLVQKSVAKKLLCMGMDLPQWLLDTYKVREGIHGNY